MGSHFRLAIFGPAKVVKERVGGEKGSRFRGIGLHTVSQEKAAHSHVVYALQKRCRFRAPFDAVFDTFCPGNERCTGIGTSEVLLNPLNSTNNRCHYRRPALAVFRKHVVPMRAEPDLRIGKVHATMLLNSALGCYAWV
jgi:hypothetical protein